MLRRFIKPTTTTTTSFSLRFCATATVTPSITSRQDLQNYKKKAHALFMIRNTPHLVLSSEAAIRLITQEEQPASPLSIPPPTAERMTREEAKQFLRDCNEAGIVSIVTPPTTNAAGAESKTKKAKQLVITEPNSVFNAFRHSNELDFVTQSCSMFELAQSDRCYKTHQQMKPHKFLLHQEKLENSNSASASSSSSSSSSPSAAAAAAVLTTDPDEVVIAAKQAHGRFWAWIAFGMSCQLLLFAYWTFLVYDWDTMEPFTYFVGCGYMITFFAYFVSTRRGHSFAEMDKMVLRNVLKSKMVMRK